jgi:alanine dehydrogenase
MLILDEADIGRLLTMDDALPAVRSALLAVYGGTAVNLAKERATVHGETLHSVGAVLRAGEGADHTWHGATIYVSGSVRDHWTLVFNGKGLTAAVAGKLLSRLRTGAASGVSADALAAPGVVTVACLGAGYQAWTQVEAVSRVRPIGKLLVWSRTRERAESFTARVSDRQGLPATAVSDVATAVADADIVIAITKARDPIVLGRDIRPGAHVILGGSSHVDRREADADLFARASAVFADDLDLARGHSGDLIAAVESGALHWADVQHLGAALSGPGASFRSEAPDGISVFCNHGVGSWDLELAMTAISRARSNGTGTELDLKTGWLTARDPTAGSSGAHPAHKQAGEEGPPDDLDVADPRRGEASEMVGRARERIVVVVFRPAAGRRHKLLAYRPQARVPDVGRACVVEVDQPPARRQERGRLRVEGEQPASVQVVSGTRGRDHVHAGRDRAAGEIGHVEDPVLDPVAEAAEVVLRQVEHRVRHVGPDPPRGREPVEEHGQEGTRAAADVHHALRRGVVIGDDGGRDPARELQDVGQPVVARPVAREAGLAPDVRALLVLLRHTVTVRAASNSGAFSRKATRS